MKIFISKSPEETIKIAEEFTRKLKSGDIIGLEGELGSGKTVFVKGIAKQLGCKDEPLSPTFTIINEYYGKVPLYHFDLYRIDTIDELETTGYYEYFKKEGICVIEWIDKFPEILPDEGYIIKLEVIDELTRKITIGKKNEIPGD